MCDTCGCSSSNNQIRIIKQEDLEKESGHHEHVHTHESLLHTHSHTHTEGHEHMHEHIHKTGHHHHDEHEHEHVHVQSKQLVLELDIMQKNNLSAARNRGFFDARKIRSFNLVSSPGSGKTSLLEKTIKALHEKLSCFVIEGDQQTTQDAKRIKAAGAPVVQINTGNGCHLDADMVGRAIKELDPTENSIVFIENVGNLVCPALFDLGETGRVVVISVTEGDDKPLKYPTMFQSAQLCIINKTDLLPYVDFSLQKVKENANRVNPRLQFIELSVRSGEGFDNWLKWLNLL